jgi:hypothetical protein
VETLDPIVDLHNTINIDEWWENEHNWENFKDDHPTCPTWAMTVSTTTDTGNISHLEPKSFRQAMSGPLSAHWQAAVDTELAAHTAINL